MDRAADARGSPAPPPEMARVSQWRLSRVRVRLRRKCVRSALRVGARLAPHREPSQLGLSLVRGCLCVVVALDKSRCGGTL